MVSERPLAITMTVGVSMGYAVFQLLLQAAYAFILPLLLRFPSTDDSTTNPERRLTFHIGDYKFDYTSFTLYGISVLVFLVLAYFFFVRHAGVDTVGSRAMRECPECTSEISADARRCAFCTSAVSPLGDATVS